MKFCVSFVDESRLDDNDVVDMFLNERAFSFGLHGMIQQ